MKETETVVEFCEVSMNVKSDVAQMLLLSLLKIPSAKRTMTIKQKGQEVNVLHIHQGLSSEWHWVMLG